MVKNQLFTVLPDIDIIIILLETFGLSSLQDTNFFTKQTLVDNDTINKYIDIHDKLQTYYLPCKKKYLDNKTNKGCITILRQFIKPHGYTLVSKERYIKREKMCVYRLIELDDKESTPTKKKEQNITISFE
tara:strand:- start:137 stop:529 length:393 start_codon:yes stop_codon:yes gene_type:complete